MIGRIFYFTPYALDKNFFREIDSFMNLIHENDWVCILDGDTMFMYSDFGHKIQRFIDLYPDTGLFTCVSNRCHYHCQQSGDIAFSEENIVWHRRYAEQLFNEKGFAVKEVQRRIAGHMMIIRKGTWSRIRNEVLSAVTAQGKQILGVDTKISNAMVRNGLKIRIMEGFYLFHFLRFDRGVDDKSHLV